MFGLGIWEIAVIVVVALIVLGPKQLPDIARQLGKMMRDLRRAADDIRVNFEDAVDDRPRRPTIIPPRNSISSPPANGLPAQSPSVLQSASVVKVERIGDDGYRAPDVASPPTALTAMGSATPLAAVPAASHDSTVDGQPAPQAAVPASAQRSDQPPAQPSGPDFAKDLGTTRTPT